MTDDTESELHFGDWTAVTSSHGASLRGLTWRGQPVVTGYRGATAKQGGQGDVLLPFPGRVKAGRYTWDGVEHQLSLNDKEGPNAIHGFVRTAPWLTESYATDTVTYRLEFTGADGYPFQLGIRLEYRLAEDGLAVTCEITNTGAVDAPVGVGFHPYFTVGSPLVDADVLELPFGEMLVFEQLVPTGEVARVSGSDFDFRVARPIGTARFNHCFAAPTRDLTGRAIVTLRGNDRTVRIWMDGAFGHVVVYTGDALPPEVARTSIAIEPMTCATDALNHPAWGLIRLAPDETRVASWGVGVVSVA